ncbi:hypothetical protein FJZ36_00305 [Candidatus Poribacteria bacterium]|nr:hypothetical protein [Candidatus Poribacteria bacterium]
MSLVELLIDKFRQLLMPAPPPDPQVQLKELLARLHAELRDAKIQAADMIRQKRDLERALDEQTVTVERLEASASSALRSGSDASARRYVEQKLHAMEVHTQLAEQVDAFRAHVQGLLDAIETYKLEIERVEQEQRTWEVRQRTAQLKSSMTREVTSTSISEARRLLQSSRDAALHEEARAEVRDTVRQRVSSTAPRSASDRLVDREIERLRAAISETPQDPR